MTRYLSLDHLLWIRLDTRFLLMAVLLTSVCFLYRAMEPYKNTAAVGDRIGKGLLFLWFQRPIMELAALLPD